MFSLGTIDKKNSEALKKKEVPEKPAKPRVWAEDYQHPDHTVSDWIEACSNHTTLMSYHDWVEEQLFQDSVPNDKLKIELYEDTLNKIADWSENRTSYVAGSAERARQVLIMTGKCPKEHRVKIVKTKSK